MKQQIGGSPLLQQGSWTFFEGYGLQPVHKD
jgi:hypothetical protein